jgi:hypothetical protein
MTVTRQGPTNRLPWLACCMALLALHLSEVAGAQGDGPRSQTLLPVGMNFVVPTYLDLSGNYNFAGTILIPGADISSEVWVMTYTRAFAIGDRYAQVWINPIAGSIEGRGTTTNSGTGQPVSLHVSESGLGDALVSFKYGLIGTPALRLPEFAQRAQGFQLSAFTSVSLPIGDYSSDRQLNLGTNVWALRLGLPMVVPLGDPRSATFLEIFPSITFYQDNKDPTGGADKREQDPLFVLESHLSRNFTPRFWASIDLRYRYGGETTTDDVADDNQDKTLGGGLSIGYAFTGMLSMQGSYGQVLNEGDGGELEMVRLKMAVMF